MEPIYLNSDQVPAHLKGEYAGKKFKAELVDQITIPAEAGLWSGGSRDIYFALDLSTGERKSVTDTFSAPWDKERQSQKIALKSGFAVVRRSTFQGVDLGLTFYLLPSDAAPLLPPPAADLTETEKKVLAIIAGLKSGYRADEYRRKGISESEVEAIKSAMTKRGFLNKAGAITPSGRNACAGVRCW